MSRNDEKVILQALQAVIGEENEELLPSWKKVKIAKIILQGQ
jgi:hypothetical protein